jgi:uncharacterized protein Yka (UPF0111/DUF47 family)
MDRWELKRKLDLLWAYRKVNGDKRIEEVRNRIKELEEEIEEIKNETLVMI